MPEIIAKNKNYGQNPLSELIRQYTIDQYVSPAHSRGDETVTIRAGDVADALRLTNTRPAVFFRSRNRLFERRGSGTRIASDRMRLASVTACHRFHLRAD